MYIVPYNLLYIGAGKKTSITFDRNNIFWYFKNFVLGIDEDYLILHVFFNFFLIFFFFFQEGSGACQHPNIVPYI